MMNKYSVITLFLLVALCNCKKQQDHPQYTTYNDFYPLTIGKYITYQLDSTITTAFGAGFTVRTYTIKDSVEAQITDNENRLSYRIGRYRLLGQQWVPVNAFLATPLSDRLEYVENNLRIIKLVNPVVENKSWQGNQYISQSPFFDNSDYLTWNYRYSNPEEPFSVNSLTFDSSLTVVLHDSLDNRAFYYKQYSSFAKGYEVYAKHLGKIYQDILNWEYQAFTKLENCTVVHCVNSTCDTASIDCNLNNCDSIRKLPGRTVSCDTILTGYYYAGYGVKLTMIDHN